MLRNLSIALALGLIASVAQAEEKDIKKTDQPVETRKDKENPVDNDFLIQITQCCNSASNHLTVGANLASSEKVKEFATKAKKGHADLKDDLGKAIKDKKIAIVATPDKEAVSQLNELRKKEKAEFDKTFLDQFIKGHEKAIKMCEHQKDKGKDETTTKLAEKLLPVLKDHLKQAKELQKDIK